MRGIRWLEVPPTVAKQYEMDRYVFVPFDALFRLIERLKFFLYFLINSPCVYYIYMRKKSLFFPDIDPSFIVKLPQRSYHFNNTLISLRKARVITHVSSLGFSMLCPMRRNIFVQCNQCVRIRVQPRNVTRCIANTKWEQKSEYIPREIYKK